MDIIILIINIFIAIANLTILAEVRNVRMDIIDLIRGFHMRRETEQKFFVN